MNPQAGQSRLNSPTYSFRYHNHFGLTFEQHSAFNEGFGRFTDVIIRCRDKQWPAHRGILAAKSQFFYNCFNSTYGEPNTYVISMDDNDPSALEVFLEFLYSGILKVFYVFDHSRAHMSGEHEHMGYMKLPCPELISNICRVADKYDAGDIFKKLDTIFHSDPRFDGDVGKHCEALLEIIAAIDGLQSPGAALLRKRLVHNLVADREVRRALDALRLQPYAGQRSMNVELVLGLISEMDESHWEELWNAPKPLTLQFYGWI